MTTDLATKIESPFDGFGLIALTRGEFAIVDAEICEELSALGWYCSTTGYAVRLIPGTDNPKKFEYLHRRINQTPDGMDTDHINGDKLDDRRANLRSVTHADNLRNTEKRKDNTSGFKGVGYFPQTGRWRATIKFNGKSKHIGFFATAELAHQAHTQFVKQHFSAVSDRHLQTITK